MYNTIGGVIANSDLCTIMFERGSQMFTSIQRYTSEGKVHLYNSCNVTRNIQILINDRSSMTRSVSAETVGHVTYKYVY